MPWMRPLFAVLFFAAACCTTTSGTHEKPRPMNEIAHSYVKLVLALGQHDPDYVDAFYGPPQLRKDAEAAGLTLETIQEQSALLIAELERSSPGTDPMLVLRHRYLIRQLQSLQVRTRMLEGVKLTFDEESKALYDAVAPTQSEEHFKGLVASLDRELPGTGTVADRIEQFKKNFIVPREKLDVVFRAAIAECRQRTLPHITLPLSESFTVEYVTNKSWSGYNWYQGNFRSLIQVNTDLPIYIDRAIDLACHEGHPGHHVYNVLLEKNLVKDRGWIEFTIYPLFSPQSLIAEGTANYGIEVAFPGTERLEFEQRVLFPLAGIDPSGADRYYKILAMTSKLSYAGNEAARRYLDGQFTLEQAVQWEVRYSLRTLASAQQRMRFVDQYRSYVINYNLGEDLVRQYVERHGGANPQRRWEIFEELLSSPRLPSDLRE